MGDRVPSEFLVAKRWDYCSEAILRSTGYGALFGSLSLFLFGTIHINICPTQYLFIASINHLMLRRQAVDATGRYWRECWCWLWAGCVRVPGLLQPRDQLRPRPHTGGAPRHQGASRWHSQTLTLFSFFNDEGSLIQQIRLASLTPHGPVSGYAPPSSTLRAVQSATLSFSVDEERRRRESDDRSRAC
jgi:hypothetical protein